MKTMLKKAMVMGVGAALFMACSADEAVMVTASNNEIEGLNSSFDIQNEDLVGTWKLVSMVSKDVPVDLNLDDKKSHNILSETACFEQMYFTFDLDGNVETQQAKLNFRTIDGKMECESGIYTALYQVIGKDLKIGFEFQGTTFWRTRQIDVVEENGEQFLAMELTYSEAKEFISDTTYVSPTGATSVKAIDMRFRKQ